MHLSDLIKKYRIRRDGWSMDFEGAVQLDSYDANQENETVDLTLEFPPDEWGPVRPRCSTDNALNALGPLTVVDGVRRLHMRLMFEHDGVLKYSGLGTAVVGALRIYPGRTSSMQEALIRPSVNRYALLGKVPEDLEQDAHITGIPHPFNSLYLTEVKGSEEPNAPIQALQTAMRKQESLMAQSLHAKTGSGTILVDGPLPLFADKTPKGIVGYVKTLLHRYLPLPQQQILSRLKKGERSPFFVIQRNGKSQVSWYLRLSDVSSIAHSLTGLVRLEVQREQPREHLDEIRDLADQLACVLPLLVVEPFKDARSPQNLLPIQALENQLKNLIGNETLLQRRLDAYLHNIFAGASV